MLPGLLRTQAAKEAALGRSRHQPRQRSGSASSAAAAQAEQLVSPMKTTPTTGAGSATGAQHPGSRQLGAGLPMRHTTCPADHIHLNFRPPPQVLLKGQWPIDTLSYRLGTVAPLKNPLTTGSLAVKFSNTATRPNSRHAPSDQTNNHWRRCWQMMTRDVPVSECI